MKICPKCQTPNSEVAKYCEQCGAQLLSQQAEPAAEDLVKESEPKQVTRIGKQLVKNNYLIPAAIAGVLVVAVTAYFIMRPSNETAQTTTVASSAQSSQQEVLTESTEERLDEALISKIMTELESAKYDALIAEAKQLTINGKYKESELKLATIPVSDLGKELFSEVKTAAADLNERNKQGLAAKEKADKEADEKTPQETQPATGNSSSNNGFSGNLAKWSNTYFFYYSQKSQKQATLTISANGGATQDNYDGTQFFGQATIAAAGTSALSYATDQLYPSRMPDTKTIQAEVQITVTWDNGGGTQVFYGYQSYSSRLALTDGMTKGAGVNEVWISY